MFYDGVQASTIILWGLTVVLALAYAIIKFSKRGYIFSFQNIHLWMEIVILCVITPVLFNVQGVKLITNWSKSVSLSLVYMEKALMINCIGTSIFLIFVIYKEFYGNKFFYMGKKSSIWNDYSKPLHFINKTFMKMEFDIVLILYGYICAQLLHGFPISADTDKLMNSMWRVVYLICMAVVPIFTFYFLILFMNEKKGLLRAIIGVFACFTFGKRSTILLMVLYPAIIYYLMFLKMRNISKIRRSTKKIIFWSVIFAIVGLAMMGIRSDYSVNFYNVWQEVLTGNTFADIRDGGLILYRFEKIRHNWVLGRTYLADFFTFIPSSIFKYRRMWGWGAFSSYTLCGMANHPGLRGGEFMETYINFGYAGIVLMALFRGYIVARYENIFFNNMIEFNRIDASKGLILYLWGCAMELCTCSAGFNNVYCVLGILAVNYLLYILFPNVCVVRRRIDENYRGLL